MQPYCRNNSNFTFREICCGKPLYCDDDYKCNCGKNSSCNNNHFYPSDCYFENDRCNCKKDYSFDNDCCKPKNNFCDCNKHKKHCNNKQNYNIPYVCLPIKRAPKNRCNPFTFVMIGYMLGKHCDYDDYENFDDNF